LRRDVHTRLPSSALEVRTYVRYARRVIQLRGLPISHGEAAELARRLRTHGDPVGVGVAERLERGLVSGVAVVGTSRPEAEVLLRLIEEWAPERLLEVARDLRRYLNSSDMAA
jgi:hypothetical protein